MDMSKRSVIVLVLVFTLPMFAVNGNMLALNASAADACSGDIEPINWNQTIGRSALVPHYNYYKGWFGYDYYEDEKGRDHNRPSYEQETLREKTALNPEEEWMYVEYDRGTRLAPLTSNYHTTMLVGNDSVGALRVNLSSQHRTTVCISVQSLNQTDDDYSVDVYLLTTSEYNRYTELYYSSHTEDSFYNDLSEVLSDISPEWRSFDFTGWRSYRDAHQYESIQEINFALNLDGPESYTPIFGGEQWQDFYIVIDTWDNNHDRDAVAPDVVTAADVTLITTERSFILPNYTVAIIFLLMIVGMVIFPFILNSRYMKAGLEVNQTEQESGLVPSLETQPEISREVNSTDGSLKDYPEIMNEDTGD